MRFYLHIGTEKTGTTTLQFFLQENRKKLAELGYGFTESAGRYNNIKLPVAAYAQGRRDDFTHSEKLYTSETFLSYQQTVIADLKKEILTLAKPNIIFSSEHIQSRLTTIEEVKRLQEILISLGAKEIVVVVYLRNPADIANSLYSTAIKTGSTYPCPPKPAENEYYHNICDHKHTLETFSAVFGKQSIVPRLFTKSNLVGGSVISDFISVVGLPANADYVIPNNRNESLSATGLQLLRRVNERVPRFMGKALNPLRGDIISYFQTHYGKNKYFMSTALYQEYEDEFRASNEWVRENWYPTRDTLFPNSSFGAETLSPVPEHELDSMADMIADIWISKSKQLSRCQSELSQKR